MRQSLLILLALLICAFGGSGCSGQPEQSPDQAALAAFNKKTPQEKFEWARDVGGMSVVMRLKQIDIIEGALDGQKQAWKNEILQKYKGADLNAPDYPRY